MHLSSSLRHWRVAAAVRRLRKELTALHYQSMGRSAHAVMIEIAIPCILQFIIGERLALLLRMLISFRVLAQHQLRMVRLWYVVCLFTVSRVIIVLSCLWSPVVCRSRCHKTGCADMSLLAAQPHRVLHCQWQAASALTKARSSARSGVIGTKMMGLTATSTSNC